MLNVSCHITHFPMKFIINIETTLLKNYLVRKMFFNTMVFLQLRNEKDRKDIITLLTFECPVNLLSLNKNQILKHTVNLLIMLSSTQKILSEGNVLSPILFPVMV